MKFSIPFTISNNEKLKERSKSFKAFIKPSNKSPLDITLKNLDVHLTRPEYLSIVLKGFISIFIGLSSITTAIFFILSIKLFYIYGLAMGFMFSGFIAFVRLGYPKTYHLRKQKDIEKNIIPALQDILIQLNSGIPLFTIMTNISFSNYGELSLEFKKAIKRINSGELETEVLDDLGKQNPSLFFRRTLWQISNGMRAGSDMSIVIEDSLKSLNEEQLIQIQDYGNKLNPLIMFYMLISVIIPALSITFITIITSMANFSEGKVTMMLISLFIFTTLIQVMFLGLIKSKRPSLL